MNFHAKWGDASQPGAKLRGLDSVAIPRDEVRCSDTRDADRHYLPATKFPVTFRGRKHDVRVVNLSDGGAMIASRLKPILNEHLELHLGEGSSIECVVRWTKEGRMGLEFAHETQLRCPDDDWADLLREVIREAFPHAAIDQPPVTEAPPEQRTADRHPLIWAGVLAYGPNSWPMRVRNISNSGALVMCAGGPAAGSEVLVDFADAGTFNATVSWAVGDHRGLRFDEPFDLRLLKKSKPIVAPPRWMRPAYLEDVPAESAWDEAWSRMSVDQLREHLEGYMKR